MPSGAQELLSQADRAFDSGSRPVALETYALAAAAAKGADQGARFREAAAMVAAVHALEKQLPDARAWLQQASQGADATEPLAWTRLLLAQGLVAHAQDETELAVERLETLFAFAKDQGLHARSLQAASLAAWVAPDAERRLAWSHRAVQAARGAGKPRWEAAALAALAWTFEEQGDAEAALEAFRSSRTLYRETGSPRERLKADWSLAHGLRLAGHAARARGLQELVLEAAKAFQSRGWSPNDSEWVARSHEELAILDEAAGRFDSALRHLAAAHRAYMLAEADSLAPARLDEVARLTARIRARQTGRVGSESDETP